MYALSVSQCRSSGHQCLPNFLARISITDTLKQKMVISSAPQAPHNSAYMLLQVRHGAEKTGRCKCELEKPMIDMSRREN